MKTRQRKQSASAPLVVKVRSASEDRRGRRHIVAVVVGFGTVVAVKMPGVRAWEFDREYDWSARDLFRVNFAITLAWRAAMKRGIKAA